MIKLVVLLIGISIILIFSLVLSIKTNVRNQKEIKRLENLILIERKQYERFEQIDKDSKEKKESIENADIVTNVDNAFNLLRDIKRN